MQPPEGGGQLSKPSLLQLNYCSLIVCNPFHGGIAIGNHTCNPTCELLAIAPINKHIPITVIMFSLVYGANENTVA
jgi:hypothetical protein